MRADILRGGLRGRRALAATVVAAAIAGTALTAAPAYASAAAGPISIGHAATETNDHASFTVPVWTADTAQHITAVSASLSDGTTTVEVPGLTAWPGGPETWTPASDLRLTEDGGTLPHLGDWTIDVTATDDQGNTVTRTGAGTLHFDLTPVFAGGGAGKLSFDPATVDADHSQVTVDGVLLGAQPGSGDLVPLAGRTVAVRMTPDEGLIADRTAVTDAEGHFSSTFSVTSTASFGASYTEHSAEVDGTGSVTYQTPKFVTASSLVTVAANAKRVLPGQDLTLSGVVHATSDAASPGVAGVPVSATFGFGVYDTAAVHVQAVTDATGHFTLALPADPESSGVWQVNIVQPFRTGSASGQAVIPDESLFTGVSSSLSVDDRVTVSGKLLRSYHRGDATYGQNVGLWYSPDGKTGWKGLAGVNLTSYDGSFKITTFGYLDGYYQVRHATSDQLVASNGPVVHLTRTNTRVFQMYANSARVKKGSTLTLTGNLKQAVGTVWKPYPGQYVELYFQPKGSTKWTYIAYSHTDSTGHARFTSKAVQDGRWLIQYFGDATHFESDAAAVFVDVV